MSKCNEKMWTMKVSTSNKEFLYSLCDKKDQTFNDALNKLIEISRLSRNAVQKIMKQKGSENQLATEIHGKVRIDNHKYGQETNKDY